MKESSPENSQSGHGGGNLSSSINSDSTFTGLNAIVLSIEWEITDDIMTKFLAEIEKLKILLKNDENLYPFLQLHGSVGKYIREKKVSAHPDSVRLLHSVQNSIMKISATPQMPASQKKTILSGEILKFKELKRQILKTEKTEKPAAVAKVAKKMRPQETAAAAPVTPPPEPVTAAAEEKKTIIKEEQQAPAAVLPPKRSRFGLKEKMISLMLAVSLTPLFLFWGITFNQTNDRIRSDSEKLLRQTSTQLSNNFADWVDKNIRMLKVSASLPVVSSMDRFMQELVLRSIQKEYPWSYLVFTLDKDGMNVARSDELPLVDFSDQQYYRDIRNGKDIAWQIIEAKEPRKSAIVLAVPIRSGSEIVGVLALATKIEMISKHAIIRSPDPIGVAFLVDTTGKLITHQDPKYNWDKTDMSLHPMVAAFKKGQRGLVSFSDENNTPYLGHAHGTVFDWVWVAQAEKKEVFQILKKAQLFAYIYLGATIIIVLGIALIAGSAMTRPIKELTDAAERICAGELDVEIKVKRKDEIGELAEAVAQMRDTLRLSIERLSRRQ